MTTNEKLIDIAVTCLDKATANSSSSTHALDSIAASLIVLARNSEPVTYSTNQGSDVVPASVEYPYRR